MSVELKPCPFCGSEPEVSFDSVSCGCAAAPFVNGVNSADIWNRRAERSAGGVDVTDAEIAEWVERHDLSGVLRGVDARCAFDDARTLVPTSREEP